MTRARLRAMPEHAALQVSDWVARWAPLVPVGGAVLDLACGTGRHARFLAARGHPVLALDRNAEALAGLRQVPGVDVLEADLEAGHPWPLPGRRFACVVVTNYLHRPLFPAIADAVDAGGVLIYETFMSGNERFGRPSNPEFLLKAGELLQGFGGPLTAVAFEQGVVRRPGPAVVQRLCARRAAEPAALDDCVASGRVSGGGSEG